MGNTPNSYDIPQYDDGFDLPNDLQDLADALNIFANIRRGTASQRTSLTSGRLRDGLLFSETDTGLVWVYDADTTTWIIVGGLAVSGTITPGSGTTWDASLTRVGKRVFLDGRAYKGSGVTFTGSEVAGTIPTGFRPSRLETFLSTVHVTQAGVFSSGQAYMLNTSGNVQVNMNGAAGVQVVGFNASWLVP